MAKQQSLVAKEETKAPAKKTAYRRRKKATMQVENYYALLEITEDATVEVIKRKYIEKVKQYPPESYPEEFQNVRMAYDNLRDPELRKKYDILRKYGESINDLIHEANKISGTKQAIKLLERAVTIDPLHLEAHLTLMNMHILQNTKSAAENQFAELKKIVTPEEWPLMIRKKVEMLTESMYYEAAFDELQELSKCYPNALGEYWTLYVDVYEELDCEYKLLNEIEQNIAERTNFLPTDIVLYTGWINIAFALKKSKACKKAQSATKKFIKTFHSPNDKNIMMKALLAEYDNYYEDAFLEGAKVFIDLALFIDKSNQKLQEQSRQVQLLQILIGEIERLSMDFSTFPLLLLDVVHWLTEEFKLFEDLQKHLKRIFSDDGYLEELKTMDEAYAAGILYVKKRYPTIYRHYQQRWDDLLKQKTAGLNREERRNLRI